jgi:hypothetical protein
VKSAELAAIEKAIDEFMSKAPPGSAFKVLQRQGGPCVCSLEMFSVPKSPSSWSARGGIYTTYLGAALMMHRHHVRMFPENPTRCVRPPLCNTCDNRLTFLQGR